MGRGVGLGKPSLSSFKFPRQGAAVRPLDGDFQGVDLIQSLREFRRTGREVCMLTGMEIVGNSIEHTEPNIKHKLKKSTIKTINSNTTYRKHKIKEQTNTS